jgi:ATP-binding cassette subfamily B protein
MTARAPASKRAEDKLRAFHEEAAIAKTYDLSLLRRLWPFVKPHAKMVVASLLLLILIGGVNLARPLVMGDVVRQAEAKSVDGLLRDGLLLTGLVVALQVGTFIQVYAMQVGGARAMSDLREHIFKVLQRLQLRFVDKTPVGRLVTRATNDVDALGELFASGVLNALGDVFALVGIVIMMLILDWRMSLIAFAALPVVGMMVNFVRKRSRDAYRDIRSKTARLNAFLNEQVSGISVVQAYAREKEMADEFDAINEAYRDANKRSIYYEAVLDAAIEMVSTVCIASVLWWAGMPHVTQKPITFAILVTFSGYIRQFFEPISLLSTRYTVMQSALSGAERIFQLLDDADVEGFEEPKEPVEGKSDLAIELSHVDFEYKAGVPVLKDVSIVAKKGEKIAFVGATGAGKTTVASLLLRLYEIQSGTIRVMGRDVKDYPRSELRRNFAVVPQDVVLFAGTILSNVAVADATPDRARALRAFDRIGASDLFRTRHGGEHSDFLDAPVDERGSNFSAGERQLLSFARALYADAPILVLDEATASVDSDTEARLQKALEAVMEDRTALVIAHRLSTVRAVDRIVVFHRGKVVEQGTHDELIGRGGVYAKLYRLQFARQEGSPASLSPTSLGG